MEVARLRRIMQGLHSIESGNVDPRDVINSGWAHAVIDAANIRIGRSASQGVRDHSKYVIEQEARKAACDAGFVVIGALGISNDFVSKGD